MERSPGKRVSSQDDACSTQGVSHHADHFSDGAGAGPKAIILESDLGCQAQVSKKQWLALIGGRNKKRTPGLSVMAGYAVAALSHVSRTFTASA